MNKSWLRKMIWSYIPIFLILFSFAYFMFFQTLVEQNEKNSRQSNESFANQLLLSVDVSLKSVDHMIIREMMNNKPLTDFFDGHDDVYLKYQVAKRLTVLKQEVPLIDSFYLVRFSDQLVYNGNVIGNIEQFEDFAFIQKMRNREVKSPWTDVRTYREFSFQNKKDVISLVHHVPPGPGSEGLFVINISAASLQELVTGMYDVDKAFVDIYDRNGIPLFRQAGEAEQKEVLTRIHSQYTGWTVESGVYRGEIMGLAASLSGVWMLLGVLVFIAGVVSIIYITRKNYKPLEDLIMLVHDKLLHGKDALGSLSVNEFAFIESAINKLAEKSKTFEKEFENAALHKRKNFFNDLAFSSGGLYAYTDSLPLPPYNRIKVFVIEIDNPEQLFCRYKAPDQSLFKFVLSGVANEMFDQHDGRIWLEWTSQLQLTGMVFMSEQPDTGISDICESIIAWVSNNLKFTVTIGLGESADSLEDADVSYKEAAEALKFKAALGHNRIITIQEARQSADKNTNNKHLQAIHSLVQRFRLNEENWPGDFRLVFDGYRECCLSKNKIIELSHYLVAHMDLHISQISKDYYAIWTQTALPEARRMIGSFDTLEELQLGLYKVLEELAERLTALREGRQYHQLMQNVKAYIECNYANPDLSLDYLSDKFSINPKYLSQLFKEECGENFLEFLAEVRIQHAKKWLAEHADSIQDVGERVGYVNAATFRRVFRRVEGISPMDYRKRSAMTRTG
ncbi:helix-turn-helix domain-containing protein [Paenibacillus abyssi]|uniref:HTH araC/xylS-type domain-containing protein n=1 Tax=Paenibacillus abyssi TaxID=1340531 RepID=A0A917D2H9_9BACL|nr:helix-turn-helix domain-containing protein [Paenibacillus abyssi]GGG08149.1 hypothetical protein GCM10010916_26320 [Paenibacillus abyssi]